MPYAPVTLGRLGLLVSDISPPSEPQAVASVNTETNNMLASLKLDEPIILNTPGPYQYERYIFGKWQGIKMQLKSPIRNSNVFSI
jgi:hypothetical protein